MHNSKNSRLGTGALHAFYNMNIKNYKNQLLIAMPSMRGEFFTKSVVFIYEHSASNGTLGFIINKPLSAVLGNVFEHLDIRVKDEKIAERPIFSGGPMGPDQGFVIHDLMNLAGSKNDLKVTVSTSREILVDIGAGKGPDNFMITLGYSGWEPGQLEHEIAQNDWLVVTLDKKIIFDTPIPQRWSVAALSIGIDMNRLSSQVGHA